MSVADEIHEMYSTTLRCGLVYRCRAHYKHSYPSFTPQPFSTAWISSHYFQT